MGKRRIARVLAQAGLHLGATTVRRRLQPSPKPPSKSKKQSVLRTVTAKGSNHVWHLDFTPVPTAGGFWISWLPFALPQRWPFCWWVAVVIDHFSRRALGTTTFKKEPTAGDVMRFLNRVKRRVGCWPHHLITDHGAQFTADEFGVWCRCRGINRRFGAIGKYGSLAVIERFIRSHTCPRSVSEILRLRHHDV
jgi:transposase InsO family protein